jgi:hypothetical protein
MYSPSVAHEEHRYTIFKESLRDIDQHNAAYAIGVHSYIRGIGSFNDKTMEEFEAMGNGFRLSAELLASFAQMTAPVMEGRGRGPPSAT